MDQKNTIPRNILVVDDEVYVCDALRMLLSLDGHDVVTANSGAEALNLYGQRPFDLVITDYSMPMMKGDELAAAIKDKNPTQPIVMISAYVEALSNSRTELKGIDVLVSKPFRLEQIREAIAKALFQTGLPSNADVPST